MMKFIISYIVHYLLSALLFVIFIYILFWHFWALLIFAIVLFGICILSLFLHKPAIKKIESSESIKELKEFLGYDFGTEFTVMEDNSQTDGFQNNILINLKLSDISYRLLMEHLKQINLYEFNVHDDMIYKVFSSNGNDISDAKGSHLFYRRNLTINPDKTIHFHQFRR